MPIVNYSNGPNFGLIQPLQDNPAYDPTKMGGVPDLHKGGGGGAGGMIGQGLQQAKGMMGGAGGGGGGGAGGGMGGDQAKSLMGEGGDAGGLEAGASGADLGGDASAMGLMGAFASGGTANKGLAYMVGDFLRRPSDTGVSNSPYATHSFQSSMHPMHPASLPGMPARAVGGPMVGGQPYQVGDNGSSIPSSEGVQGLGSQPPSTGTSSQSYNNSFNQLSQVPGFGFGAPMLPGTSPYQNQMAPQPAAVASLGGAGQGQGPAAGKKPGAGLARGGYMNPHNSSQSGGYSPRASSQARSPIQQNNQPIAVQTTQPGLLPGLGQQAPQPIGLNPQYNSTGNVNGTPVTQGMAVPLTSTTMLHRKAQGGHAQSDKTYLTGEVKPEIVIPEKSDPYIVGQDGPQIVSPKERSFVMPNAETALQDAKAAKNYHKGLQKLKDRGLLHRDDGGDLTSSDTSTVGETGGTPPPVQQPTSSPMPQGGGTPSMPSGGGSGNGVVNMGATSPTPGTPPQQGGGTTPQQQGSPAAARAAIGAQGGAGGQQGGAMAQLNHAVNQAPMDLYKQLQQSSPQAAQSIGQQALGIRSRLSGSNSPQITDPSDMMNYAGKQMQLGDMFHPLNQVSPDQRGQAYNNLLPNIQKIDPGAPQQYDPAYHQANLMLSTPLMQTSAARLNQGLQQGQIPTPQGGVAGAMQGAQQGMQQGQMGQQPGQSPQMGGQQPPQGGNPQQNINPTGSLNTPVPQQSSWGGSPQGQLPNNNPQQNGQQTQLPMNPSQQAGPSSGGVGQSTPFNGMPEFNGMGSPNQSMPTKNPMPSGQQMAAMATGDPNAVPMGWHPGHSAAGGQPQYITSAPQAGVSNPVGRPNSGLNPATATAGSQPLDKYSLNAGIGNANPGPLGTNYTDWRQNQDLRRTDVNAQQAEQQNRYSNAVRSQDPALGHTQNPSDNLSGSVVTDPVARQWNQEQMQSQQQRSDYNQQVRSQPNYNSSDYQGPRALPQQQGNYMQTDPSVQALRGEQGSQLQDRNLQRGQAQSDQQDKQFSDYAHALNDNPNADAQENENNARAMINDRTVDKYAQSHPDEMNTQWGQYDATRANAGLPSQYGATLGTRNDYGSAPRPTDSHGRIYDMSPQEVAQYTGHGGQGQGYQGNQYGTSPQQNARFAASQALSPYDAQVAQKIGGDNSWGQGYDSDPSTQGHPIGATNDFAATMGPGAGNNIPSSYGSNSMSPQQYLQQQQQQQAGQQHPSQRVVPGTLPPGYSMGSQPGQMQYTGVPKTNPADVRGGLTSNTVTNDLGNGQGPMSWGQHDQAMAGARQSLGSNPGGTNPGEFQPGANPNIQQQLGHVQANDQQQQLNQQKPPQPLSADYRSYLNNQLNDPKVSDSVKGTIGQVLQNDDQLKQYAKTYQPGGPQVTPWQAPNASQDNVASRYSPATSGQPIQQGVPNGQSPQGQTAGSQNSNSLNQTQQTLLKNGYTLKDPNDVSKGVVPLAGYKGAVGGANADADTKGAPKGQAWNDTGDHSKGTHTIPSTDSQGNQVSAPTPRSTGMMQKKLLEMNTALNQANHTMDLYKPEELTHGREWQNTLANYDSRFGTGGALTSLITGKTPNDIRNEANYGKEFTTSFDNFKQLASQKSKADGISIAQGVPVVGGIINNISRSMTNGEAISPTDMQGYMKAMTASLQITRDQYTDALKNGIPLDNSKVDQTVKANLDKLGLGKYYGIQPGQGNTNYQQQAKQAISNAPQRLGFTPQQQPQYSQDQIQQEIARRKSAGLM